MISARVTAAELARLEVRLAALERAAGLPRMVPMLSCWGCGYQTPDLTRDVDAVHGDIACPGCGNVALGHAGRVMWPPQNVPVRRAA